MTAAATLTRIPVAAVTAEPEPIRVISPMEWLARDAERRAEVTASQERRDALLWLSAFWWDHVPA